MAARGTAIGAFAARADLDAFLDAAARFAGDSEDPTLGAFLAFLKAADEEENGLDAGRVGESNSVKLMTIHASKGLEWPVVVVPGMSQALSKTGTLTVGTRVPRPRGGQSQVDGEPAQTALPAPRRRLRPAPAGRAGQGGAGRFRRALP